MARLAYDTSYRGAARLLRGKAGYGSYAVLVAALLAAPFLLPGYYTDELAYLFIVSIASLGLMVLIGFTGQVSLGPMFAMAVVSLLPVFFFFAAFQRLLVEGINTSGLKG